MPVVQREGLAPSHFTSHPKPQHIVLELRSESQLGKTPGPALSPLHRGSSSVRGLDPWSSVGEHGCPWTLPCSGPVWTRLPPTLASTGGWHAVSHK